MLPKNSFEGIGIALPEEVEDAALIVLHPPFPLSTESYEPNRDKVTRNSMGRSRPTVLNRIFHSNNLCR